MLRVIPFPNKKYQIIYADPPWNGLGWNNGSGKKCPALHYQVQDGDYIKSLPIREISAENSSLFLWATYPNLPLAVEVIGAWGFRFATVAFTWVKRNKKSLGWFWGCGNYTRANAEICLLGIKGKMVRESRSIHSVLDSHIMAHSVKPPETRDRIVKLFGDLPRIELFARQKVEGWDSWGNQV